MTTIKLKNGSGAPAASDLVQGEPALDLTNKRLYTEDSGGTVIEVGTNPSTLTVDTDTLAVDATNNRVGIGTTSPGRTLDVEGIIRSNGTSGAFSLGGNSSTPTEGAAIHRPANGTIAFVNESSESMRIDSGGDFLIGTTTEPSSSGSGSGFVDTSFGRNQLRLAHTDNTGAARSLLVFYGGTAGNLVGTVTASNTTTTYNTTSDQRLKENIVDAPAGNIDAIRVRSFDWKVDGSHQTYGMVAQELVDVAPEAVTQGETEDDMWAVDYSKLVPMMIKEIQDLKAEVAALKGA